MSRYSLIQSTTTSACGRAAGDADRCDPERSGVAQRRYYMTRNTLEVCRRNMVFDPRWSFKQLLVWVSGCMAVILWERDKYAKLAAIAQGAAHFLLRRFGKRP